MYVYHRGCKNEPQPILFNGMLIVMLLAMNRSERPFGDTRSRKVKYDFVVKPTICPEFIDFYGPSVEEQQKYYSLHKPYLLYSEL
jgi:hypothetical protein